MPKTILAVLVALSPLASIAAVTPQAVEGAWACEPYIIREKGMTVIVTERPTYGPAGSFYGTATAVIKADSGATVKRRSSTYGKWSVEQDVITIKFDAGRFLESSDPNFTIAMGQRGLDKQLQKNSSARLKVLESRTRLVTTPIKPMYEEALVTVSCKRR